MTSYELLLNVIQKVQKIPPKKLSISFKLAFNEFLMIKEDEKESFKSLSVQYSVKIKFIAVIIKVQ